MARRSVPPPEEADVIVVGAGTAGCVLAARLSEETRLRVCLVEAGPADGGFWTRIPIGFSRSFRDPRVNWLYETIPQASLEGRTIFWPRGRVVGGSSAINGMIHVRGYPEDYDGWGLPGWRWEDIRPYFHRSEGQRCDLPDVYGSDGPYAISSMPVRNDATEAFIRAAESIGIPRAASFNGTNGDCVGYYEINTRDGWRCDAATAYLDPATARANLALVSDATVDSIGFEGDRAASVSLRWQGKPVGVRARAGIVLAAGAVGTPALLQRSGIGPAELLVRAGVVPRLARSGIGANLQDHFGVRFIARLRGPLSINDDFRRPWRLLGHAARYALTRRGQLAIGGAEAGLFWRSQPALDRPDVQFHFLPLSNERGGWRFHDFSGVTANVCALRPQSRGTVSITSPDPAVAPAIDPRYLEAESDIRSIVSGLRLARRIFAAPPMARLVEAEHWPGPEASDDDRLRAHLRLHGSTVFHPVGTCAMGVGSEDPLRPDLSLRGVDRLWVADASAMPKLVSGNTNAATVMLAEHAAALLRPRFATGR
jgi:choline dehydrogenase